MKAKEKAEEIYSWLKDSIPFPDYFTEGQYKNHVKFTAIEHTEKIIKTLNDDIIDIDVRGNILLDLIDYWREVKLEIEKL